MAAIDVNHVSVSARDLEESLRFYEEMFGAERIPTPGFAIPVQWTRIGAQQLHLFEAPQTRAPVAHHFAITVDDFDCVFAKARARGAFDTEAFGHHIYELPGGEGQMYLRDPAGNLVEVNCPSVAVAGPLVKAEIRKLADDRPQSEENLRARLFLGGAPED